MLIVLTSMILAAALLLGVVYVEENGVYSYGCFVTGTPQTLLELLDSGAVTQIWIDSIWISI